MQEKEVKFLEINPSDMIEKLEKLGAQKTFEGEIVAAYFDRQRKLAKRGITLRLRKKGEQVELASKERSKNKHVKICEEDEVTVNDFETMKKILEKLDLTQYRKITKHRISYLLDSVHFEIDQIPTLPPFLEIEAPTIALIRNEAQKLGLRMKDAKAWSTQDVIEYYTKK
ncbi:hypothetical protein A2635_05445 [Candidatus Peribacteria bacterium RIFCSPHIGHO2_01_FULL_51_9]|nr:MAG: hypothetical protein A2635_05445 [Candidatus Peribacteria bacterium RIFCSPHIGHO2_01_FULL_51_9]